MVVITEAELFVVAKSLLAALVTVAMLVKTPSAAGLTVSVRLAVPLLTIFPNVQLTTPLVCANVPCVVVAETNEAPTGRGSVTTALDAADGPLFVTRSV